MPGLLKADESVTVTAVELDYTGSKSAAVYTGAVELRQGAGTFIRADEVTLDQASGDLIAVGNARAVIVNDADETSGNAAEIRYTDKTRLIAYVTPAPATSRLVSEKGDLRAGHIEIGLEKEGSGIARIDARTAVSIQFKERTITGTRLEYVEAAGEYTVSGDARNPVEVIKRLSGSTCERSRGMKLTMSKAADNIALDGQRMVRSSVDGVGPCTPVALPPPGPATKPPPTR
jgi:lipopolysaccharide transport protein LptA